MKGGFRRGSARSGRRLEGVAGRIPNDPERCSAVRQERSLQRPSARARTTAGHRHPMRQSRTTPPAKRYRLPRPVRRHRGWSPSGVSLHPAASCPQHRVYSKGSSSRKRLPALGPLKIRPLARHLPVGCLVRSVGQETDGPLPAPRVARAGAERAVRLGAMAPCTGGVGVSTRGSETCVLGPADRASRASVRTAAGQRALSRTCDRTPTHRTR